MAWVTVDDEVAVGSIGVDACHRGYWRPIEERQAALEEGPDRRLVLSGHPLPETQLRPLLLRHLLVGLDAPVWKENPCVWLVEGTLRIGGGEGGEPLGHLPRTQKRVRQAVLPRAPERADYGRGIG